MVRYFKRERPREAAQHVTLAGAPVLRLSHPTQSLSPRATQPRCARPFFRALASRETYTKSRSALCRHALTSDCPSSPTAEDSLQSLQTFKVRARARTVASSSSTPRPSFSSRVGRARLPEFCPEREAHVPCKKTTFFFSRSTLFSFSQVSLPRVVAGKPRLAGPGQRRRRITRRRRASRTSPSFRHPRCRRARVGNRLSPVAVLSLPCLSL